MTKERRLAIEMWTDIRNMLSASDSKSPENVPRYKERFCNDYSLPWTCNCWFCQYIPVCRKCPLKDCGDGSNYLIAANPISDKNARVEACNNIIKALGGEA